MYRDGTKHRRIRKKYIFLGIFTKKIKRYAEFSTRMRNALSFIVFPNHFLSSAQSKTLSKKGVISTYAGKLSCDIGLHFNLDIVCGITFTE